MAVGAAVLAGVFWAACCFSVGWRHAGRGSISIFREFFASVGGILILGAGLGAGL